MTADPPRLHVDPATCIEAAPAPTQTSAYAEWTRAVQEQIEARVNALSVCSKNLRSRQRAVITLQLRYAADGAPSEQYVTQSTLTDCSIAECLKQKLAAVRAPTHPGGELSVLGWTVTLELRRARAAAVMSEEAGEAVYADPALKEKAFCHDPAPEIGRLEPEVIQGVVRGHFQEFRACYEAGLAHDPNLTGKVELRFVIGRDGRVSDSHLSGNTLPNCDVARCIVRRVHELTFPAPKGGIVTVVYPIMLAPE